MSIRTAVLRVSTAVATTAIATAALVGAAAAAPTEAVQAPYAQAAGSINADGTIQNSKGVVSVNKPEAGRYCIQLETATPISDLVANATPRSGAAWNTQIFVTAEPNSRCGNRTDTLLVTTGNPTNGATDAPFNFTVA